MWIRGQSVSPQAFVDDVCQHSEKYQAMRREAFVRELITRYLLDNHDLKDITPEELEERIAGSQFRISVGDFRGNAKLITITDNLLDCAYKIAGNDPMKKGAADKLVQYQTSGPSAQGQGGCPGRGRQTR
jgi:hypothetical protein